MFDSGFGGLTVARAVIDLLPLEDLVYIGDTGRYPYGNKPPAEVQRYAHELATSLVNGALFALAHTPEAATGWGLSALYDAAWFPGLAVFVIGWIIQFVGHIFEGRKPAFVDDVVGLMVGPMFVVGEALMMAGMLRSMHSLIETQAGATR